jgi:hypothetical protein
MRRKKQMSGIIVREALRLLKSGLSDRKVAEAVDISRSTCRRWRIRADYLELTEEKLETMTDDVLHTYFMGRSETKRGYQEVDKDQVKELREKGFNTQKIYQQYLQAAEASGQRPLKQSAFYNKIKYLLVGSAAQRDKEMAQQWLPGEYMQIDYAGDKITLSPSPDGKQYKISIFVCTLCHSRLQFWYATPDTTTKSWLEGIVSALEYFGGSPKYVILDNDVALVTNAARGDKEYVKGFTDLCRFYNMEPAPARVAAPRDKGMVEGSVKIVTNRFIKKIPDGSLKSLKDVRILLAKELEESNQSQLTEQKISRRDWFNATERSKLRKLPRNKFTFRGPCTPRKVRRDGCVLFETHKYMLPSEYCGLTVGVITGNDGKLYFTESASGEELCSYRHYEAGKPDAAEGFLHIRNEFRAVGELTPLERLEEAKKRCIGAGEYRPTFMKKWILSQGHKEAGALADKLNALAKKLESFGDEDIEAACRRCISLGRYFKEDLLGFLNNPEPLSDGPKKKPSNRGACLRSFGQKDTSKSVN